MKTIRCTLAIPVSVFMAGVVFLCLDTAGQRLQWSGRVLFPLFAVLCIAAPLVAAFLAGRVVAGLHDSPSALWRRIPALARAGIIAVYLATWAIGAPAVLTNQTSTAVEAYKKERARNSRVWETHPRIRTTIAFPLLPGVVVSYHEYQVAGLDGWGGWQVHAWYVAGVWQVIERTHWIS
jgi:hypothetical protein